MLRTAVETTRGEYPDVSRLLRAIEACHPLVVDCASSTESGKPSIRIDMQLEGDRKYRVELDERAAVNRARSEGLATATMNAVHASVSEVLKWSAGGAITKHKHVGGRCVACGAEDLGDEVSRVDYCCIVDAEGGVLAWGRRAVAQAPETNTEKTWLAMEHRDNYFVPGYISEMTREMERDVMRSIAASLQRRMDAEQARAWMFGTWKP